ncbi:helix-turn-helix transcriptional regulator [Pontiellaceae bacterium B12219]|nr:helix-turn-helix transcriptional regulator [Pontiellaceae bacterium B12219]
MEQASLNIGTIGQRLESARQAKGVSVSEAGRATKILAKFIEAMEADDFGALSAPVYAKSFIRMYAQYLGIDSRPLVDEYIAQHVPKTKIQLTDEVRQNLAKADSVADTASAPAPSPSPVPSGERKQIFGNGNMNKPRRNVFSDVNAAISGLSGSGIPVKLILSVAGGVLLILIIVLSVSQCDSEEEKAPAVGSAAAVEHAVIQDGVLNAYLAKPGVVEVDKN